MATVHLEGMGVMGALTAYQLQALGVSFTWHERETYEQQQTISPTDYFTAWHASTGAIFPTGNVADIRCKDIWEGEFREAYPEGIVQSAQWWFGAKKPPHEAPIQVVNEVGGLKMGSQGSLHVDAQRLVRQARQDFAASRISMSELSRDPGQAHRCDLYLISHGWQPQRLTHVYWGWTRRIKLKFNSEEISPNSAFYFRKDRFFIRYAYPIGGSGWWYAGSTITRQKEAKHVPGRAEREYERWKKDFLELTNGMVEIVEEGAHIEGWRPAMGKMHDESPAQYEVISYPKTQVHPNYMHYPSRSHDGIRRFPDIWRQVHKRLVDLELIR